MKDSVALVIDETLTVKYVLLGYWRDRFDSNDWLKAAVKNTYSLCESVDIIKNSTIEAIVVPHLKLILVAAGVPMPGDIGVFKLYVVGEG